MYFIKCPFEKKKYIYIYIYKIDVYIIYKNIIYNMHMYMCAMPCSLTYIYICQYQNFVVILLAFHCTSRNVEAGTM